MILVDTGPFVALFNRRDRQHAGCVSTLRTLREPLCTTVPVLTEAFHMLGPSSKSASLLRAFVERGGASVFFMDAPGLIRAFELMDQYRDRAMDLADASLVTAAERLKTRKIFTLDRKDFTVYRAKFGHQAATFTRVD